MFQELKRLHEILHAHGLGQNERENFVKNLLIRGAAYQIGFGEETAKKLSEALKTLEFTSKVEKVNTFQGRYTYAVYAKYLSLK